MKKVTKATFKSFIKKNEGKLYIKTKSRFDGMTDGIERVNGSFRQAEASNRDHFKNTLGIDGVWLVGGGRDYFNEVNENGFTGIEVYNCCGSFIVATQQ